MGQFGSSIGIWNQYSKIFRTQYFWIIFGINIPNFNSVNLGPFIEVLPNFFDSKLFQDNFKDDFTSVKLSSTQLGTTQPQLVSIINLKQVKY